MTGRPAAFSALALASTASVADSVMAEIRAETLVGMDFIVPSAGGARRPVFPGPDLAQLVRRKGRTDVHCRDRQRCCLAAACPRARGRWALNSSDVRSSGVRS